MIIFGKPIHRRYTKSVAIIGLIVGFIVLTLVILMNKQLQKQNLEELKKQTLLNILSAKGIIYTYYKNNNLTKRNYG